MSDQEVQKEEGKAAEAPASKNQIKKKAKLERQAAQRIERKAKDKAAREKAHAERQAASKAALASMTTEELAAHKVEQQEKVAARRLAAQERDEKRAKSMDAGNYRIVIDLDFPGAMPETDKRHLCSQLAYAYSAVSRSPSPPHLHLLGLRGDIKETAARQISGLSNWHVTQSEANVAEYFAGKLDQVVYLTADSPHTLDVLDPTKAYVIGGLVDHNRHKNICLDRANAAGIATAKLPILEHVTLGTSAVLTVNHVVEILVNFIARGNSGAEWKSVLDEVLPKRKRADWQKTKTQGKDKSPAADQPQQQQEQEHDKQHHEQKKEGLGHGQEEPSVDQGLQQQQQQQQQPTPTGELPQAAVQQKRKVESQAHDAEHAQFVEDGSSQDLKRPHMS